MKSLMTKACLLAGATLMLAQPVLAETVATQDSTQNADTPPAPNLRPYSQVELRRAYEQGRADQARDSGLPPAREGREPAGYCYQRQASARATGTIVGAVLGGVVGNGLSDRWNRGGNTIGGALIGGMLGNSVGQDSVQCYQNAYYGYEDGYYAPPPPPRGYTTIFFSSSPGYGYGYHHYRDRPYGYGRRW
jgi:hypothetical protein